MTIVLGFPVGFCLELMVLWNKFPFFYTNYYSDSLYSVGRLAIIHHTIAIGVHAPMSVMYVQVV